MANKSFNELVDTIGAMSVMELADFVKSLEEKFGVSGAMPTMAAAPSASAAAPAAQAEEKSEYRVTLENGGSEKIKTIKALRAVVSDLNLTDAKKMVEDAPQVIKESAPKDLAMKIKAELEAAGAKVTLA
jgi:large subunit ribosomal protein L7/L12